MARNFIQRSTTGFTLIEVIVAMTIFGVGVLGVVTAFSMSTRAASSSLRSIEAARLAQNRLTLATHAKTLRAKSGETGPYQWKLSYIPKGGDLMAALVVVEWAEAKGPQRFELRELFLPRRDGSP